MEVLGKKASFGNNNLDKPSLEIRESKMTRFKVQELEKKSQLLIVLLRFTKLNQISLLSKYDKNQLDFINFYKFKKLFIYFTCIIRERYNK